MDSKPRFRTDAEAEGGCSSVVSRHPGHQGIVTSVRFLDPRTDPAHYVGRSIAMLLEDVTGDDDVERLAGAIIDATSGLMEVLLHDAVFWVVSSQPLAEASLRVTVQRVDAPLLPEMIAAKAARVAEARALSERESQVLLLLLRGCASLDIAPVLGIAPRTVKFHQMNVLRKLGADSRLDLLRVVI